MLSQPLVESDTPLATPCTSQTSPDTPYLSERQRKIATTVLDLFTEHGTSFTVDQVATQLGMSKKTIYKEYRSKEELIDLIVQVALESIAHKLETIMADPALDAKEKLIRVTCTFPDMQDIDYHKALQIQKDFPKVYKRFIDYLDTHQELSRALFDTALAEGALHLTDFQVFKTITMGISKEVLASTAENKEELLETCIRQVFAGFVGCH